MYVSMHIPKTGGNTFKEHLRHVFGDDICFRYRSQWQFVDVYTPTPMVRFYRTIRTIRSKFGERSRLRPSDRCIHGHFRAEDYLAMFPDGFAMTWVRDPVERLVSQYYYWKRRPFREHSVCNLLVRNNLSLLEFAEIEVMRNLQCRYFNTLGVNDFLFIGITEQFAPCINYFYSLFDKEPSSSGARNTNPTKDATHKYDVEPAVHSRIASLNSRDYRLYEKAVEQALKNRVFTDLAASTGARCGRADTGAEAVIDVDSAVTPVSAG